MDCMGNRDCGPGLECVNGVCVSNETIFGNLSNNPGQVTANPSVFDNYPGGN